MTRAPYDTASCLAQLGNALADVRAATAAVSEARERRDRLMVRLVLDHGMSKYRVAKLAGLSDTYVRRCVQAETGGLNVKPPPLA